MLRKEDRSFKLFFFQDKKVKLFLTIIQIAFKLVCPVFIFYVILLSSDFFYLETRQVDWFISKQLSHDLIENPDLARTQVRSFKSNSLDRV